jgi:hypothetical protein
MRFPFYPACRWLSGFIRANVKGRFAVPILRQYQEPFNPVFTTNADNCGSNAASIGSSVVELSKLLCNYSNRHLGQLLSRPPLK